MSLRIFNPESYGGGGSYFTDGTYRIDEARFVKFDFQGQMGGKDGSGIACLCLKMQQLDKDGSDVGEQVVQYWGTGDDVVVKNKGHEIDLEGQYQTLWALCDFALFVEYLGKAGFDRDALAEENDIAMLDGQVMEFGKIPHPRNKPGDEGKDGKDGKKKGPKQLIVVTAIPDAKPAAAGKKGAAPAKKGAAAPAAKKNADVEDMLGKYLAEAVLVTKNEAKGLEKIQARMGISRFVQANGGDADLVKSVTTAFNDPTVLDPILESAGWVTKGTKISPVTE